jgi:urea carboxylase
MTRTVTTEITGTLKRLGARLKAALAAPGLAKAAGENDMFKTVLIANRGEIAVRIITTLKRMGIRTVAVYSDADRNSAHVAMADVAVHIGGSAPAESYLRGEKIIAVARETGAEAIIPGYGFLSENAGFAEACAAAGVVFVGPSPDQIRRFGLKHASREIAEQAGVPLTPGTGLLKGLDEAKVEAEKLGYPVMLKSTAGGGGIGLSRCNSEAELVAAYESVQRLGKSFFNDSGVFLERFVDEARHVEVQIFGDGRGNVVALGERDCSVQRRNQKVIEETPAPGLPAATRASLLEAAVKLGKAVGYVSAGTVEFIYDGARDEFYFLEVNTRLQVEHPVTESVTGLDLVEWMIRIAAGQPPSFENLPAPQGAAIEVRLYAEDPVKNFQPSPGVLTNVFFPEGTRVDGWVATGTEVSPNYDPMLAKLIVKGKDRAEALAKLEQALSATRLYGIATNLDYLRQIIASENFRTASLSTRFLERFTYQPQLIEILEPGTYTTVQDYPGRTGYWDIGVPPSGPMDDYAFRLANRIVGNAPSAAGLECTLQGPSLRFHGDAMICITGATMNTTLDGEPVPNWMPITVHNGQVLRTGRASSGCRAYIAVRQGLDVPDYLGSKSTFALGQFGGHAGRTLRSGDMLAISRPEIAACTTPAPLYAPTLAPAALIPAYAQDWDIAVLYGPHGAPDFFTEAAMAEFFSVPWEVHYNSNRLGVRLTGPKPTWTRSDGGEAGLHPSNVHDCEYAIGSINFTGDMPVILTRDGPSLGGFVCAATIIKAELWKVGQVKPGDKIRFRRVSFDEARALELAQDAAIAELATLPVLPSLPLPVPEGTVSECVIAALPAQGSRPEVAYRQAGDKYILLEYGPSVLDLRLRFRVHALMEALKENPVPGILELSPGVRSLQINYDSREITQQGLIAALLKIEDTLPSTDSMKIRSRVVHLPLAFEDSATLDAVTRYRETVRSSAPWLPNNVDFIQRINGLPTREAVSDIVFAARYMVLGLGDVYLGAPCAVPVDPRHRLMTSKYNPARTFTAEGTVGIGGVYMCIYGMDSPGGYQLVGRTLPIWNKFLKNGQFAEGEPWLLRFFDQVQFYPVTEAELTVLREDFREGRATIRIDEEIFDLGEHEAFVAANADDIADFRARQKAAFDIEVARWQADGAMTTDVVIEKVVSVSVDENAQLVAADISGNVWKLLVEPGQRVAAGEPLVILEAMKMEFPVHAPVGGTVKALHCRPGKPIAAGEPLLELELL